jgi:hypothetical protein
MASNKIIRIGPVALSTTTTTNIYNPPALTGGTPSNASNAYVIIRHIRVVNKTTSAASFALWMGATGGNAAGTEVVAGGIASAGALTNGVSVAAGGVFDFYGQLRMDAADFLVGGAGTATALTFEAEAEIGIV